MLVYSSVSTCVASVYSMSGHVAIRKDPSGTSMGVVTVPRCLSVVPKAQLRKAMGIRLQRLTNEAVVAQSECIACRVLAHNAYQAAQTVALYLAMPRAEVRTNIILADALARGKKVLLPRVTGPRSEDLIFLPIKAVEEIERFEVSRWGISEPPMPLVDNVGLTTSIGSIDVAICPGVAADRQGNRIGRGKGYYDSFLSRLTKERQLLGSPPATIMGIFFREQLLPVGEIEVTDRDHPFDVVITPDRTITTELKSTDSGKLERSPAKACRLEVESGMMEDEGSVEESIRGEVA